jgi:adenosylcobinamide-GDP ribazoletransferase
MRTYMLQKKEKKLRTNTLNPREEYTWYRGIAGLISFSTIIPLNIHTSIAEIARSTWIWPLIGGLIGALVGLVGLGLSLLNLPSFIIAALVYSFAITFTGFHHLDGLIDIGDALMAHGDQYRKIQIMRDPRIGTGGLALFFMVAITTIAAIGSISALNIFFVLFISEIAAKMGLVSCCTISRPLSDGTGRYFIDAMNIPLMILILVISLIIGFLAILWVGVVGIVGGVLGGLFMGALARKSMGYATGDVLGASNEVARMTSLIAMVLAFIWI